MAHASAKVRAPQRQASTVAPILNCAGLLGQLDAAWRGQATEAVVDPRQQSLRFLALAAGNQKLDLLQHRIQVPVFPRATGLQPGRPDRSMRLQRSKRPGEGGGAGDLMTRARRRFRVHVKHAPVVHGGLAVCRHIEMPGVFITGDIDEAGGSLKTDE